MATCKFNQQGSPVNCTLKEDEEITPFMAPRMSSTGVSSGFEKLLSCALEGRSHFGVEGGLKSLGGSVARVS